MVAKQKVPWGGIEFSAKPASKFRMVLERLHIHLPYLHGGRPKFTMTLKRLSESEQIQTLYWFMRFSNGDETSDKIVIPKLVTDEERELVIGDKLLGFTGDTYVGIVLPPSENYQTLYSFRTVAQEDFTLYAVITFGACLLATIIAFFLAAIIKGGM